MANLISDIELIKTLALLSMLVFLISVFCYILLVEFFNRFVNMDIVQLKLKGQKFFVQDVITGKFVKNSVFQTRPVRILFR